MISVIVARAGDCPHRARAWAWLKGRFDGLEVVEGYGDAERWVKADAVADGLSRASGDLLVIHDADCFSPNLSLAVEAVEGGGYRWASPYRRVRRLTEAGTTAFLAGGRDVEIEQEHKAHVGGGIVVLRRETYEAAPLDPRFVGWGQEDDAWAIALTTCFGEPLRHDSELIHLWHPPQQRKSRAIGNDEGFALRRRYKAARRSPDLMRALLDEVAHGEAVSERQPGNR